MRHRIGAHRRGEDQQHGAQHRGLDQRQRHARENLEPRRAHDGGRLLEVGVHVAEDAADEDVRERRVVQREHHDAGEQPLAPPQRHAHAEDGGEQTVGGAGHGVGIEQILPDDRQRPLRHDVGKDEDGAEVLLEAHVRARDQVGEHAAVDDRAHAGEHGQEHRVEQRRPEVDPGQPAREQVDPVIERIAFREAGVMGIHRAHVHRDRIHEDGDHRRDG